MSKRLLLTLILTACAGRDLTPLGNDAPFTDRSADLTQALLTETGGRVDWSQAHDLIAFDRRADDDFFDVWTMRPDGTDQHCFTCELPGLPTKNVGQPAWSPDGKFLVVQAQKADSKVGRIGANPGAGVGNDLWAITFPEGRVFQLTDVPSGNGHGTLHPHFSPDGRTLLWGQMTGAFELTQEAIAGTWMLQSADFVVSESGPTLENLTLYPVSEGPGFYENHGLSPDGTKWIFSANLDREKPLAQLNDIYVMDFPSGENLKRLTTGGYNEHATFTPDGERVVWMSSAGNVKGGTDYWSAKLDGSDLTRLSRLTVQRSDKSTAADLSMGRDGTSFVAYIGDGSGAGRIILFTGI